jgi:hypothetical protein
MTCKICNTESVKCFEGKVLNKYDEPYFKCTHCGFIQTSEPYWLDEAYSSAIAKEDVGLVHRNIVFAPIVSSVISILFNKSKKFIDYGGGYGLLTRMMRDKGFNYFCFDRYCENLFSQEFHLTAPTNEPEYELLTAFELFEHLVDPIQEVKNMLQWSNNILFSTELLKTDVKAPNDWWYIMPETGQHIAFYTTESLKELGRKFGLNFYTNGTNLHLFTKHKINPLIFKLCVTPLSAKILNRFVSKNRSLMMDDYHAIKRKNTSEI